jgi:hypothetical protein
MASLIQYTARDEVHGHSPSVTFRKRTWVHTSDGILLRKTGLVKATSTRLMPDPNPEPTHLFGAAYEERHPSIDPWSRVMCMVGTGRALAQEPSRRKERPPLLAMLTWDLVRGHPVSLWEAYDHSSEAEKYANKTCHRLSSCIMLGWLIRLYCPCILISETDVQRWSEVWICRGWICRGWICRIRRLIVISFSSSSSKSLYRGSIDFGTEHVWSVSALLCMIFIGLNNRE